MNAQRRQALSKVIAILEEGSANLGAIAEEEQETFDNMPEGLQSGATGARTEEIAEALRDATDALDEIISNLNSCLEN
jgi:hypothetical protein